MLVLTPLAFVPRVVAGFGAPQRENKSTQGEQRLCALWGPAPAPMGALRHGEGVGAVGGWLSPRGRCWHPWGQGWCWGAPTLGCPWGRGQSRGASPPPPGVPSVSPRTLRVPGVGVRPPPATPKMAPGPKRPPRRPAITSPPLVPRPRWRPRSPMASPQSAGGPSQDGGAAWTPSSPVTSAGEGGRP